MPSNVSKQLRVPLFNVQIDCITRKQLLQRFDAGFVVTPNVDHLMMLQDNPEFLTAYRSVNFIIVDSQIVFWALRFLGRPVPEKISGSDLLPAFCKHHAANPNTTIFMLGGMPGVAQAAKNNINSAAGRQIVIAAHSPSMNIGSDPIETTSIVELINQSKATCLVVGLGAPKQELWIYNNRHRLAHVKQFLAVGAAIDFEVGAQRRAPQWMGKMGIEWGFRLLSEPGRLWRRYLVRDPKFYWMLVKEKFL